jgi:ribosomal-protein-alanine N-acetyltransferase
VRYREYVRRFGARAQRDPERATHAGMLVRRRLDDALVGVFNLSEIVRGSFHSAYLGYYAFPPHAGAGYMAEGLALALAFAFRTLKLHRIEVNVQPANVRSRALVEAAGFAQEGYSRRYLRIGGRWRDHVRYALLADDWRTRRKARQ